jgi:hypothetical protein
MYLCILILSFNMGRVFVYALIRLACNCKQRKGFFLKRHEIKPMPRKLFVSERIQLNDAALCRGGIDLWVFKPLVLNAANAFRMNIQMES